jgi:rhodanese-related sulfurtransferase
LQLAESKGTCIDAEGKTLITLLDLRTDNFLQTEEAVPAIRTNCPVVKLLLDSLQDPAKRATIPADTPVVTITETGNRDKEAMQYLSQFGYTNIVGLTSGMRGWIKLNYPITKGN